MAPRRSSSQINAKIRQAQQRQRQAVRKAVNDYNREEKRRVDAYNRAVGQAVRSYNQDVRRRNNAVRQNRARLQQELNRLASRPVSTTRSTATARASVTSVVDQFRVLERSADAGLVDGRWLDLSEREAANSAAVLNTLLTETPPAAIENEALDQLRSSGIDGELADAGGDLTARWHGALFALHPDNPDAGRHFATSSREMLSMLLVQVAPDASVLVADPDCPRTPNGSVSRRARIHFCLARQGHDVGALTDFIDADVTNVIDLFDAFNSGTHGAAGKLPVGQLSALKQRVEDAVRFVHNIAFGLA